MYYLISCILLPQSTSTDLYRLEVPCILTSLAWKQFETTKHNVLRSLRLSVAFKRAPAHRYRVIQKERFAGIENHALIATQYVDSPSLSRPSGDKT